MNFLEVIDGWDCAVKTHPGHTRQVNEDSVLSQPNQKLWAVADGMGGYSAGDVASQTIVAELMALSLDAGLTVRVQQLEGCLKEAHQALINKTVMDSQHAVMGSTVVVITCVGYQCACLWVGDSRCYVFREGMLYQISHDHSWVQEMLDNNTLSAAEAADHPQRHMITRAIGAGESLQVDVITFDVSPGDILLLCSDGLYSELGVDCICRVLADETAECEAKANQLMKAVLDTQARDNVSFNVIQVM